MANRNTTARMEFSNIGGKLTPVHVSLDRSPDYSSANPDDGDPNDQKPDDGATLEEVVGHILGEHGNDDLQNKDEQDDQALGKGLPGQHSDGDKVGDPDPDDDDDDEMDEDSDDDEDEDVKKSIFAGVREFERGVAVEVICKKHVGFAKLTDQLASGGANNPGALAAYIGRQKYGKKKMASHAAVGKPLKESMAKSMSDVAPQGLPSGDGLEETLDKNKEDALANAHTAIMGHIEDYTNNTDMDDDDKEELEGKIEAALRAHTSAIAMSDTV